MDDRDHEPHAEDLLDKIPDPDEIRERLNQNYRERSLLKQLLRIAVRASKQREEGDDDR